MFAIKSYMAHSRFAALTWKCLPLLSSCPPAVIDNKPSQQQHNNNLYCNGNTYHNSNLNMLIIVFISFQWANSFVGTSGNDDAEDTRWKAWKLVLCRYCVSGIMLDFPATRFPVGQIRRWSIAIYDWQIGPADGASTILDRSTSMRLMHFTKKRSEIVG